MSKILSVYKDFFDTRERFIDEIFEGEIYSEALPHFTILDLGAYGGEFGFYAYNVADKIYAFEPDPKPFKDLERRVKDFNMDKMKVYPMAMSNKNGETNFFASGGGGSFITDGEGADIIKVKCITLATFMKQEGINHIDILKVDIEGGEDYVFKSEDFKDVVDSIDLIIGEHLASVDGLLKGYGFEQRPVNGSNVLYERPRKT